ncbi:MAG: ParB N-terminal domain-containing protein [Candidatus Sericytochromatia bacterium]|nr:ParB N-terminal domain-containing protein [Candidatus Sericytochromatia bacterium]
MSMNETRMMPIADIHVTERLRPASSKKVDELAASIEQVGLMNPVCVRPDGTLIAGWHRLLACKKLGFESLLVNVMAMSDTLAELAQIDENLKRNELTALEQSQHIKRREDILQQMGMRKPDHRPSKKGATVAPLMSTEDLADEMGMSKRSVQVRKQIAEGISPDLQEELADTPIADSTTQLVALAKLPPEAQADAVQQVKSGQAKTIQEASRPHVVNNSGNNEWYTPAQFVEAARVVMGSIDVDPASSEIANQTVKAKIFYTAETNGLDKPWPGNVWLNPPYSQPLLGQFIDALLEKLESGEVGHAIVLLNNATETATHQKLLSCRRLNAVCFPKGRIKFLDETGQPVNSPLQGQMIAYLSSLRQHPADFEGEFKQYGAVLKPVWWI